MFRKSHFLVLIIISLLFCRCSKNSTSTQDQILPDLTGAEKRLVESDNKFGLKLFREIIKEEKDTNVFISPLSVSMALGMTYNGANGETQKAMQNTLELEGLSIEEVNQCYRHIIESLTQLDPKVQFQIANSIWYRHTLTPEEEFLTLCKHYFDALVSGLDFNDPSAASIINAWVNENTNGKIKEIVNSPIDPLIVMFLIDAIYFKGTWTYQFDKDQTKDDWFTLPDGSEKRCKMMEQRGLYKRYSNAIFQALDLPYGNGDFSMTIFLPHHWINADSLIAQFDPENYNHWIDSLTLPHDSVDIYIPKFKLEYELKLNNALEALGMGIAFTPYAADFSKMYKNVPVWIDEVKHKTFIEVNEEGTEAAAVTSVSMAMGIDPSGFRVNRPFVFVIRENQSQTILFIGKIGYPGFE